MTILSMQRYMNIAISVLNMMIHVGELCNLSCCYVKRGWDCIGCNAGECIELIIHVYLMPSESPDKFTATSQPLPLSHLFLSNKNVKFLHRFQNGELGNDRCNGTSQCWRLGRFLRHSSKHPNVVWGEKVFGLSNTRETFEKEETFIWSPKWIIHTSKL